MLKTLFTGTGKFTRSVIVLLIGSALGWTGAVACRPPVTADGIHTGPSIERMSELSQLLTLRIDVADVLVSRIDGVTGGVQLAMLVKGDVALGIDLSQARFDKIDNAHCMAVLILPPPEASCARVDHDRSRLFELTSDGLWAITPGTRDYLAVVDKAMAEAEDLVASAAHNNNADERARRHAEVLLGAFFHSIGWEVQIRWSDRSRSDPVNKPMGMIPTVSPGNVAHKAHLGIDVWPKAPRRKMSSFWWSDFAARHRDSSETKHFLDCSNFA